ncbi:MAG: CPBP family intramembrane metalloprotease [Acidobacteria bacterium]|nr:CPBP family intramembrane metalloprotease [Acidobacteriota bacterium]
MSCLGNKTVTLEQSQKIDRLSAASQVLLIIFFFFLMAWVLPSRYDLSANLRFFASVSIITALFSVTIFSHLSYEETFVDLGFGKENFWQAIGILTLPVFLLSFIVITVGINLGTVHIKSKMIWQFLGIPFWALVQQYLLQSIINKRLQVVFGKGWLSISLTAIIFALVHLPNPALTIATLVVGFLWAYSFQKAQNLYAIAISHGILSTLFANFTPKWLLPNMVVGYNYLIKIGWITANY